VPPPGGGTDHHTKLVPHGEWALVGNPNRPDGLRLVRRDALGIGDEHRCGDARAGPMES